MTGEDEQAFTRALLAAAELFSRPLSKDAVALYFGAMSRYKLEDVKQAIGSAIQTSRTFPNPAELATIINSAPVYREALPAPAEARKLLADLAAKIKALPAKSVPGGLTDEEWETRRRKLLDQASTLDT
jgi:hypothetical protein